MTLELVKENTNFTAEKRKPASQSEEVMAFCPNV